MNVTTILVTTFFAWNICVAGPETDGIQCQKNEANVQEAIVADLALMEGYERYLNDPTFDITIDRIA